MKLTWFFLINNVIEITVDSLAVVTNNGDRAPYPSPTGNIFQNYSAKSQPGYWHWHDPLILLRFPQLYLFVCVLGSIQFITCARTHIHDPSRHRAFHHLKHKDKTSLPIYVKLSTTYLPENWQLCKTSITSWSCGQPHKLIYYACNTRGEAWDLPGERSSRGSLNDLTLHCSPTPTCPCVF